MSMLDGLIEGLAESPAVKQGMEQFKKFAAVAVATVERFDKRFDLVESKMDRILNLLENPPDMKAAGEHVLALVPEQKIYECPLVGCTISTIHEHGDGKPVRVSGYLASKEKPY